MPAGPLPTGIVWTVTCFTGSIRETLLASTFATQTEPAPAVTALGEAPTATWPVSPPFEGRKMPTVSADTAAAVAASGPLLPRVVSTTATTAAAAATTPAAARTSRRRGRPAFAGAPVRGGGNLEGRPSTTSWYTRSGRSMSLSCLLAQVLQRDPGGKVVVDELCGRVRQQHLAAVRGCGDAGAAVQADPVVPLVSDQRLAGVEPHPDPALDTVRPLLGGERALGADRRLDGVLGAGEREEERVALVVHLAPALGLDGGPQDPAMGREKLAVPVPELLQEPRRALDVGEEHRHRPSGQRTTSAHRAIVPQLATCTTRGIGLNL